MKFSSLFCAFLFVVVSPLAYSKAGCDVDVSSSIYNASGNGIDDDTDVVLDAIADTPDGGTICFPETAGDGYRVTTPIRIPSGISVEMEGYLISDMTTLAPALIIGDENGDEANSEIKLSLRVIRKQRSWLDEQNNIGIKLINLQQSEVRIDKVKGFAVGVQLIGVDGKGNAFNTVTLGAVQDNKIGLELTNESGGYVNENLFLNGQFRVFSTSEVGTERYGVRITSIDEEYINNNNNVFIKPSFELKNNPDTLAIPVHIAHGKYNQFISCRSEGSSSTFAKVENQSEYNTFDLGFTLDDSVVDDTSTKKTSYLTKQIEAVEAKTVSPIFDSGPVRENITHWTTGAGESLRHYYHFPWMHVSGSGGDGHEKYSRTETPFELGEDYVGILDYRGVGVYIDTSVQKRFVLRRDYAGDGHGYIRVSAFDEAGQLFECSDLAKPFPGCSQYFGNSYYSKSEKRDYYFAVDESVKKIALRLSGVKLKRFSLISLDGGSPRVWSGYEEGISGAKLANKAPVAEDCSPGRIVFNASPTSGESIGWVCTESQVWKTFGVIAQ